MKILLLLTKFPSKTFDIKLEGSVFHYFLIILETLINNLSLYLRQRYHYQAYRIMKCR